MEEPFCIFKELCNENNNVPIIHGSNLKGPRFGRQEAGSFCIVNLYQGKRPRRNGMNQRPLVECQQTRPPGSLNELCNGGNNVPKIFILGPLLETALRQSLIISHGGIDIFVTRPSP